MSFSAAAARLIFLTFVIGLGCCLEIEVTPKNFDVGTETVSITCRPDSRNKAISDIMEIQIAKDWTDHIATFHKDSGLSYGKKSILVTASGNINTKDVANGSYLNVTLFVPGMQAGGTYTCIMYYTEEGLFSEDRAVANLEWDRPSLGDFQKVLKNLLRQMPDITKNMDNIATKDDNIRRQVRIMKKEDERLTKETNDLMEKEAEAYKKNKKKITKTKTSLDNVSYQLSYISAFHATIEGKSYIPALGRVIVFDKIMYTYGNDYSATTGIYTAPIDGLYSFHFSLRAGCAKCQINAALKKNEEIIIQSTSVDNWHEEQTHVATAVLLFKGDRVSLAPTYLWNGQDKWSIFTEQYSSFAGFLIKANIDSEDSDN